MLAKNIFLFGSVDVEGGSVTHRVDEFIKLQNKRVQIAHEKLLANTGIEDYLHADLLGVFPFIMYSTDWMGREVFHVDDKGTPARINDYNRGVRDGSFGLLLNSDKFGVRSVRKSEHELMAALYLQVSIVSQALIFVTWSHSWSFIERPSLLLVSAFMVAQLVATLITVYANWGFARIKDVGWGWAGVIWLYSIVFYIPLDIFKFGIRYILIRKAWDNLLQNKTAFTTKKDYGIEEREAQWALAQRTLHGLQAPEMSNLFAEKSSYRELSEIAEHYWSILGSL